MESIVTKLIHRQDNTKKTREEVPTKKVPRPAFDPPYGMEPYDSPGVVDGLGALSDLQQEELNHYKGQLIQEDENYLRNHPEITCIVNDFMVQVLQHKPADIDKFACDYFSDPWLSEKVAKLLEEHDSLRKLNTILSNSFLDL